MSAPEALAFDMYGTLVDPIRIWKQLEQYIPDEDALRVAEVWRQKQLELTFRLTVMERYEDFEWITRKALDYALAAAGQELEANQKDALIAQYNNLERFDDVDSGLKRLQEAGHEMVVFSNGTPAMLQATLDQEGLHQYFQGFVSVDEERCTSHPRRSIGTSRIASAGQSRRSGLSPRTPSTMSGPRLPGCGRCGWTVPVASSIRSARLRR